MRIKYQDGRTTRYFDVDATTGGEILVAWKEVSSVWKDEENQFNKDDRRQHEHNQHGDLKLVHIPDPERFEGRERDPAVILEKKEINKELETLIKQLRPELRDLIIAKFFYDTTLTEYAEKIGKSKKTVSRWLRKALGELRNNISKQ